MTNTISRMNNALSRNLKIIFWNTQSLRPKYYEIVDYFASNHYDVICFSETWLKNIDIIYLLDYKSYRTDRQTDDHGGVAIAIHKTIPHKHIHITTNIIENITIDINTLLVISL